MTMLSTEGWKLECTYRDLGDPFYSRISPTPVKEPQLVLFNESLAQKLGLIPQALKNKHGAQIFSGNELPPGAYPIAQAYAGHQFGHFTLLGDGRAILLGEQISPDSHRWDIQLKGAGQTPYSRRGDGRAALGPMLREYLISEAMAALRIPTTRSLAVTTTGEPVFRECILPGAVLTRVASSHIRVGTFEYAARVHENSVDGKSAVEQLAHYAIQRHYPECVTQTHPYIEFLKKVIEQQAQLIAQWMLVGFIHGVMNTDNMLISGETIDYGPCAFMDHYDPATVFSSIDHQGRYAYGNQPAIALWNLTRLAETLLPLLSSNENESIEIAKHCLEGFSASFHEKWSTGMKNKLGLPEVHEIRKIDEELIEDLLNLMKNYRLDYTLTFRALSLGQQPEPAQALSHSEFKTEFTLWKSRWETARGTTTDEALQESQMKMRRLNPNIIPRNHRVEEALKAFVENQNQAPFEQLLKAVTCPFDNLPEHQAYLEPAPEGEEPYQTFCGT